MHLPGAALTNPKSVKFYGLVVYFLFCESDNNGHDAQDQEAGLIHNFFFLKRNRKRHTLI